MTTNQTGKYRTLTLKNGAVVLAVSEVRALALGPRQAKEMIAELAKAGISAEVYKPCGSPKGDNSKYIKIN